MADVYCDQVLTTGLDDGTDWTNAYKLLSTALNGTNTAAGDTLWVKNNSASIGSTVTLLGASYSDNPPRVIGCKAATTATPPATGDIVPGLRTGDATRAYDQTSGNAAPILKTASNYIRFSQNMIIYGIVFDSGEHIYPNGSSGDGDANILYEECHLDALKTLWFTGSSSVSVQNNVRFLNCKGNAGGTGGNIDITNNLGFFQFDHCIFDLEKDPMIRSGNNNAVFNSCDFSAQSGAIMDDAGGDTFVSPWQFKNNKIHASSALVSGSIVDDFRTEFWGVSSATSKTTGQSFQEIDIITAQGDIVVETTRFRTGGSDDGASGEWSLAFTPGINGTRDNLVGLIGPKISQEIIGDGTSQTLTVHIANNTASTDYKTDHVALFCKFPSASGDANYDFVSTQMNLEATPADLTDDTGSTWGTGANNHQKLSVSFSPDYDGFIEWWIVFYKNFGSSPDTLYVDGLGVLT